MEEGCARAWDFVAMGPRVKLQVETKADMKLRFSRSPDLADAFCFQGSTLVLTDKGEVRIDQLEAGDIVVTPFGPTRIAFVHVNSTKEMTTVNFSNGSHLFGKGEHKIFTWKYGWIRLDTLRTDMECETSDNLCVWQFMNLLFTKERRTSFKHLVDTLPTEEGKRRRDFYIESSGVNTLGLFLMACVSIIKTVIGGIMKFQIWNSLKEVLTQDIMPNSGSLTQNSNANSWQQVTSPQPNGIGVLPDWNGIKKIAWLVGKKGNLNPSNALSVERFSKPLSNKEHGSAQLHAEVKPNGKGHGLLLRFVWSVVKSLWHTGTSRPNTVPIHVEQSQLQESKKVYNLTLVDHNVYYANRLLVANCTGLEGCRRLGLEIGGSPKHQSSLDALMKEFQEERKKEIVRRELTYK